MEWQEQQQAVRNAIAAFPREFGLRAFPGKVFMIDPAASYYSGAYGIMLYTAVKLQNGNWASFAKGTPRELRQNMVKL